MTALIQPPPRIDLVEIVQEPGGRFRGRITRPWSDYFDELYTRVGGAIAPSNDEIYSAPSGVENTLSSEPALFALANELAAIREQVAALEQTLQFDQTGQIAAVREEAAGQMRIRRIIRSTVTINAGSATNTYAISPALIDLDRAELRYLGVKTNSGVITDAAATVELTNLTTVTASRITSPAFFVTVAFEITEYV